METRFEIYSLVAVAVVWVQILKFAFEVSCVKFNLNKLTLQFAMNRRSQFVTNQAELTAISYLRFPARWSPQVHIIIHKFKTNCLSFVCFRYLSLINFHLDSCMNKLPTIFRIEAPVLKTHRSIKFREQVFRSGRKIAFQSRIRYFSRAYTKSNKDSMISLCKGLLIDRFYPYGWN